MCYRNFLNKHSGLVMAVAIMTLHVCEPINAQPCAELPSLESEAGKVAQATTTPASILIEIEAGEKTLFELFNALNTIPAYDIACRNRFDEEAGKPVQNCEPVYMETFRQEVSDEMRREAASEKGLFAKIRNSLQSPEQRAERLLREKAANSYERLSQSFREDRGRATATPWFFSSTTRSRTARDPFRQARSA